jgi:hypothetical protein
MQTYSHRVNSTKIVKGCSSSQLSSFSSVRILVAIAAYRLSCLGHTDKHTYYDRQDNENNNKCYKHNLYSTLVLAFCQYICVRYLFYKMYYLL